MADNGIWDAYVKKFGSAPKDATQLQQFSKTNTSFKPLSFKDSREIFNAHKTKPVVTNNGAINKKPLPASKPIKKALPSKYSVQSKTTPNLNTKPNKPFIPSNPNNKSPISPRNKSPISPRQNTNNRSPFPSAQPISPRQNNNRSFPSGQPISPRQHQRNNNQPQKSSKPFDPKGSKEEFKRQIEECESEITQLKSVKNDFEEAYNAKIKDIDEQFKKMYDALKQREQDLKRWRKQEYDEGLQIINNTSSTLQTRINGLKDSLSKLEKDNNPTSEYNKILYNIPKINDFKLNRFSRQALQINNVINNVFIIGQTYQQNMNNTNLVIMKINKNPQNNPQQISAKTDKHKLDFSNSPFGKGKVIQTNNYVPPGHVSRQQNQQKNKTQKNGTRPVTYNSNAGGIRGFDIGNNAKYAKAQQMARNTNALPSNVRYIFYIILALRNELRNKIVSDIFYVVLGG